MSNNKKNDSDKLIQDVSEKAKQGFHSVKAGVSKAKDSISSVADNVIQSIDQTDDGKFNLEDVIEIKRHIQEKQKQMKLRKTMDTLCPIFNEDISSNDFMLSRMVRIVEMDKKHALSGYCKGSIGHESLEKDLWIMNIYPDRINDWGLQFYPDQDQEFYLVNPANPIQYIAADDYFDYMRRAKVSELQRIAQDLGAVYFRVVIKELKRSLLKKSANNKTSAKAAKIGIKVQEEHSASINERTDGEIVAETCFEGHAPIRPQLYFYKTEPQIKSLIAMRLDNPENVITSQTMSLKSSRASGITKKFAGELDAAFNSMKCSCSTSFSNEVENEVRQIFEFTIKF